MKAIKEYLSKLRFVFAEIFKAGPGVFYLSVGSMIISGLSPVATVYLTSRLIAEITKMHEGADRVNYQLILTLFFSMLVLVVISFAIQNVKNVICAMAGLKLTHNIENLVAEKSQEIKQERIDDPEFLDFQNNTLNKCGSEPLDLMEGLFGMVASIISVVGYAVIIIKLNVLAFFVIVAFTIPIIIFKRKYQGLMFHFFCDRTTQMRKIWYYLSLMTEPQYTSEMRSYELYPYFYKRREEEFADFIGENKRIAIKEIIVSLLTCFFAMIGTIIVGIWLVRSTLSGNIAVSDFYLFITAIITIVTTFIGLSTQIASNSKSMMFIDYIFKFMAEDNTITSGDDNINEQPVHEIEFQNVSFKYPGSENYALRDVSIKVSTNETVCLVGENGSGKSTLVKLLLRIYDPTEGRILLDGVDIKEYEMSEIRKFFGVLFQDYIRFSDNVSNSIGFGDLKHLNDIDKIKETAKITGADEYIEKYKDGYEENLSKMFFSDAVEPSGGQWQKLAITRALYSDSSVLVLDEPTAALDPKAEVEMFETFRKISNMRSTIIISHRMYITKMTDKIIVLANGKLKEWGSFDNLLSKKGEFYDMYKLQADSYAF